MTRSNTRLPRHLRLALVAAMTVAAALPSAAAAVVAPTPITDGAVSPAAPTRPRSGSGKSRSVTQPVLVTSPRDGTNRLFIVEKTGRIRIVKNGSLLATPFLDISASVSRRAASRASWASRSTRPTRPTASST